MYLSCLQHQPPEDEPVKRGPGRLCEVDDIQVVKKVLNKVFNLETEGQDCSIDEYVQHLYVMSVKSHTRTQSARCGKSYACDRTRPMQSAARISLL